MNGVQVAQLALTVFAVLLVLTPLLVLAYVSGRGSSTSPLQRRLTELDPSPHIGGRWQIVVDDESGQRPLLLDIVQTGGRFQAEGRGLEGARHAFEGIVHRGRLSAVTIEDGPAGLWIGTVTAELLPGSSQITGMRSRWAPDSQTLLVRRITFTRVDAVVSAAEHSVHR